MSANPSATTTRVHPPPHSGNSAPGGMHSYNHAGHGNTRNYHHTAQNSGYSSSGGLHSSDSFPPSSGSQHAPQAGGGGATRGTHPSPLRTRSFSDYGKPNGAGKGSSSSAQAGAPAAGGGRTGENKRSASLNAKYADLPSLLRDCATLVERKEFNPLIFQAMGLLHSYSGEHSAHGNEAPSSSKSTAADPAAQQPSGPPGAATAPLSPGKLSRTNSQESMHSNTADMNGTHQSHSRRNVAVDTSGMHPSEMDGRGAAANSDGKSVSSSGTNSERGGVKHHAHHTAATARESVKFLGKISKKALHGIHHGVSAATKMAPVSSSGGSGGAGGAGGSDVRPSQPGGFQTFDDAVDNDWCEEHFTMGCHCKKMQRQREAAESANSSTAGTTTSTNATASSTATQATSSIEQLAKNTTAAVNQQNSASSSSHPTASSSTTSSSSHQGQQQQQQSQSRTGQESAKPCFQRPVNPKSNLIANGWIEQQRRSKMRVVWKDILASLVEGRRPGEETTLWIQRQVTGAGGKQELEALHQIPMKWIEDVSYLDFYGDHRFALKIFNVADEFQFRTRTEESAQQWVVTLKSAVENSFGAAKGSKRSGGASNHATGASGGGSGSGGPGPGEFGLNNLDDWDSNSAAASKRHSASPMRGSGSTDDSSSYRGSAQSTNSNAEEVPPVVGGHTKRLGVRELRAIVHGAGIDTRGMERADLERLASRIQGQPDGRSTNREADAEEKAEERRKIAEQRAAEERRRRHLEQQAAEERRRQLAERERLAAEERRRQQMAEQAAEERRAAQQKMAEQQQRAAEQRAAEQRVAEERRRQQMAEQQAAEERRRQQQMAEQRAAEEMRRQQMAEQQAAAEQRRRAEEERKRQFQQQQQQQQQQQAAEQRRRHMEQQAAEERQRQQQYHQQQQQHHHQQQQQQPPPQWNQQQYHHSQHHQQQQQQQHFFHGQQQQHHQAHHQQPFHGNGPSPTPPPPPPGNNGASSPINAKYAKAMADKTEDEEQAAISMIKRNILIHWALQPPNLNALRPIDQLICSLHTVFPPAFGVPSHDYFKKWKPLSRSDLVLSDAMGQTANEDKLKKAVRKIRFFLHPDKLPKDLNSEQEFMCKMLWDVTSDAWEEFCTKNEELDWVR